MSSAYFNPRSREGSDQTRSPDTSPPGISIRAPARGATCQMRCLTRCLRFQSALPRGERHVIRQIIVDDNIFQSALPRGERPLIWNDAPMLSNFNPRSREGSDLTPSAIAIVSSYFNPRSREGSDPGQTSSAGSWKFQSALPRGERHYVAFVEER